MRSIKNMLLGIGLFLMSIIIHYIDSPEQTIIDVLFFITGSFLLFIGYFHKERE